MKHADIIASLGGPSAVCRFLGLPERTATHWGRRGIPAKYWLRLSKMERKDGGTIDIEAFDAAVADAA